MNNRRGTTKINDPPPKYTPRATRTAQAVQPSQPAVVPTPPPAFESRSDLIIAIDFGTTFTGVAYAHAAGVHNATTSPADMVKAADKVYVIKSWPCQGNQFQEKTPSLLSYTSDPPGWGANVKIRDERRIAHFKLGLQENIGRHYLNRSMPSTSTSVLGGYLSDHNWKHPNLPNKTALDYTGDYLTRVRDYVITQVLPSKYGAKFLQNQQISYIITVPAIWSDKAKDLTRRAAVSAGIPRKKLMLITEPEAAAVFCATLCREVDLQTGDRFLICDAGGGTVVRPATF
jgi:molecular chaperone DnaK (HSP70)